ncbi:MAG: SDR family oxidoreductase [Patescibacteria group bacterium]
MSEKIPLAVTGTNGLVGSRFITDFADRYDVLSLDRNNPIQPVDITDSEVVEAVLRDSKAEFLVHFAAFTDVNAAWRQQGDKNGLAYQVNVAGTNNLVSACEKFGKRLIHVSTAYVFDGNSIDQYRETDTPHAIEWYGQTKLWAEEIIQSSTIPWTIFRIDQPFASQPHQKLDIAHRLASGLQNNTLYPQFTNHYFGPTIIEDFAKTIDWAIRTSATGLYHASSGERWSDFQFAQAIKDQHLLSGEVKPGNLDEYLKTQPRPYQRNTALDCTKLHSQIDFTPQTVHQAISKLKF